MKHRLRPQRPNLQFELYSGDAETIAATRPQCPGVPGPASHLPVSPNVLAQPKMMVAVLARPFHLKLGVNELKHNAHCQRQECSDARGD
jgi:hypothetical protein